MEHPDLSEDAFRLSRVEMELNWNQERGVPDEPRQKQPIQLVPVEVWGKIFNKLKTKDVANARLVCKQFAHDVMDNYNYAINLNEDSTDLDYILQLRIVSLDIKRLVRERIADYPTHACPGSCQPTLKYPNVIRRIKIDHSPIDICNINNLISLCHENLTHLYILPLFQESTLKNDFPTQTPTYRFPNLQTCHLKLDLGQETAPDNFIWSTFANSDLPKLQNLHIELNGGADGNKIVKDLVKLITKNPKGLERLAMLDDGVDACSQQLSSSELVVLDQIKNLRSIELYDMEESYSACGDIFRYLVGKQQKLDELKLHTMTISGDAFRSTILNNSETIEIVQVKGLVLSEERPFDLSVFKNCSDLIKLELGMRLVYELPSIYISNGPQRPQQPQLVNLDELPEGIVKLKLRNFHILSRDIIGLLRSDALKTLKSLTLCSVGRFGNYGINSEVLETIAYSDLGALNRVEVDACYSSDCLDDLAKHDQLLQWLGFGPYEYDPTDTLKFKGTGVYNRLIPRPFKIYDYCDCDWGECECNCSSDSD